MLPYIVNSRKNDDLLQKLLQDDYPIVMEGVHCTYLLRDKRFNGRKCFVRLHNVEHIYYHYLSRNTNSIIKRIYFLYESFLLKKYEKYIADKATFWSVIEKDNDAYRHLGCKRISFLPLFLPEWNVNARPGNGTYCLYQGDLSVGENDKAARWLTSEVFATLNINLVISGKNPSAELEALAKNKTNLRLVANPGNNEMQALIEKAHINIIPSFNSTGIKIKLVNALFNGRHCLVNVSTVDGTGLAPVCTIADSASEFRQGVINLFKQPFLQSDIDVRKQLLENMYDNKRNALQIIEWIWGK